MLWLLWLLLLSGHKSGEEQEGEGGERRASTRRPARTRHCGRVWGSVGSLGQAARAREMEHPQAVMGAKGWFRGGAGKDARGSEFGTILRPRGGGDSPAAAERGHHKLGVQSGPRQPTRHCC